MAGKNIADTIAQVLVIIGGLNWGLIGVANLNVVNAVLGSVAIVEQIVYIVVGLAALYVAYATFMKK